VSDGNTADFDMEAFGDEAAQAKMFDNFGAEAMIKVEKSPEYRKWVLGLIEEAAKRNVI